jgi:heme A synthase
MHPGQVAFRWLTAGVFILAVGSIAFAGFGVFDAIHNAGSGPVTKKTIEHGYAIHIAVGSVTVLAMLALPIIAWRGRLGTTILMWSCILAALGIIQAIVGSAESVPALGLLHGLLAAAIVVITGTLSHRAWTGHELRQSPPADTAPA